MKQKTFLLFLGFTLSGLALAKGPMLKGKYVGMHPLHPNAEVELVFGEEEFNQLKQFRIGFQTNRQVENVEVRAGTFHGVDNTWTSPIVYKEPGRGSFLDLKLLTANIGTEADPILVLPSGLQIPLVRAVE